MVSKRLKVWAIVILSMAGIIFLILTAQVLYQTKINWLVDFEIARNYAATVGGLLSFISVVLIFITIENQRKSFVLNQFENKFFEQVKFHRKNVDDMRYKSARLLERDSNDKLNKPVFEEGGRVIYEIYREIRFALEEIKAIFEGCVECTKNISDKELLGIFEETYLIKFNRAHNSAYSNKNLFLLAQIEIAYLTVFFGLAKTGGRKTWQDILNDRYNNQLVLQVKEKLSKHVAKWDEKSRDYHGTERDLDYRINKNYHYKFFGGHQGRLGHYFRNLFQTVRYVDDQKFLSYKQKYQYIKTLRAQLTTYEQCIIYMNSISLLGRIWELDVKDKKARIRKRQRNKQLITKYNFIKNIPGEFFEGIHAKDFYPNIQYEGWDKSEERKGLEKKYK